MQITERLESRARAVVRAVRDRRRRRIGKGPHAVYANIIDGERLWLALADDAGEPALRDLTTGEVLRPTNEVPASESALEPGFRSVRWLLDGVLPAEDGATLEVVALGGDGRPETVRVEHLSPARAVRHPTTPDGRWRFVLERAHLGALHVRRVRAPRAAHLVRAAFVNRSAVITCEADGRESADLVLLDKEGEVAAHLPMQRTSAGLERVLSEEDMPATPSAYRVMIGSPEDHVPVARWRNDLRVVDPTSALLPLVIAHDSDRVVARVRWSPDGTLRLVRLDPDAEEYA